MERRETLSGVPAVAAVIGQISNDLSATQFRATALGTSSGHVALPDGTPAMLNVVSGHAALLGTFRGQIFLVHNQGENSGVAFALLLGDRGSILRMTIEAVGVGESGNGDRQVQPAIRGRYFITGGAGALASATGGGTIAVITNLESGGFMIEMQGQIAV
jgi:hypothetical protein